MSIRLQILLPLIVLILAGLAMAGLIGSQAIDGHRHVEASVATAMNARVLSTEIGERVRLAEAVLDRVAAMTSFVPAAEVEATFTAADKATEASLAALAAIELSPAVTAAVRTLVADYKSWRESSRIALGLDASNAVPTSEALTRKEAAIARSIAKVQDVVATSASDSMAAAGSALAGTIKRELTIAAAAAAGILVLMLLVANLIARPIVRVTKAMQHLARGEVGVAVPAARSSPEIRAMVAALTVFRDNAEDRRRLQSETQRAEALKRTRDEAVRSLMAEMEEAIELALRGDFTRRLETRYADTDLARFSEEANRLLQTVQGCINETARVMGRLAKGELGERMQGEAEGSFGALTASTNTTMEKLQDLVRQIRSASDTVRGQSQELLFNVQQLSQRTARQTSALESTNATLGTIQETIDRSTDRAASASRMVGEARVNAERSSGIVGEAVAAMRRIESGSNEIGMIIEAIDGISFQTNLLALNAGVEAARAGEAGRGFAVVAQEVRELARRAASSANDIKALVEKSRREVDMGVKLVNATGEALGTIRSQVGEIDGYMTAIASAAKEQSAGMREIRNAVGDIDRMTQENAAMTEASTAATQVVSSEADTLSSLIAQFRLEQGRAEPAGTRPASGRNLRRAA